MTLAQLNNCVRENSQTIQNLNLFFYQIFFVRISSEIFFCTFAQDMNKYFYLGKWDEWEDIENHPAKNIRHIYFDSNSIKNEILIEFSKRPYFTNLKTLCITGDNTVFDLETFTNASESEFTLTSLEHFECRCDSFQSEVLASWLLNKNFEHLLTLDLTFAKSVYIDFDDELARSNNMRIKNLSLCNVNLGAKACLNFSAAFKDLEVLGLNKWKIEQSEDSCFFFELPKLKALAIIRMNEDTIRSLIDKSHPLFSSTNGLRSKLESICLEEIQESLSST